MRYLQKKHICVNVVQWSVCACGILASKSSIWEINQQSLKLYQKKMKIFEHNREVWAEDDSLRSSVYAFVPSFV